MINLKNSIIAVYSIVGALVIANLIGTNALATQGIELDKIHQQINEIDRSSQEARVAISKATNLEKIQGLARNMGYIHAQQVYHLNAGAVVAYSPAPANE